MELKKEFLIRFLTPLVTKVKLVLKAKFVFYTLEIQKKNSVSWLNKI